MTSFDVTSFYTNISIIDTLNLIKDYVKNDDQSTGKMALTQEKFFNLGNMVLTTIWHTFIFQFYRKTDRAAMFKNGINVINKSF